MLGLEPFAKAPGRHVFYRCGDQMLLIFNPDATAMPPAAGALPVPPHGADGRGPRLLPRSGRRDRRVAARTSKRRASPSKPTSNGRTAGARSISAIRPATASSSPSRASGGSRDAGDWQRGTRAGRREPQPRQGAGDQRPDRALRALELSSAGELGLAGARGDRRRPSPAMRGSRRWQRAGARAAGAGRRLRARGRGARRRARHLFGALGRARARTSRSPCSASTTRSSGAEPGQRAGPRANFICCAVPCLAGRDERGVRGQGVRSARLAAARGQGFRL